MSSTWISIAFLLAVCCHVSPAVPPVDAGSVTPRARVESGELSGGVDHTPITNRPFYSFLGIPYASPPVHKNRFKVTFMVEDTTFGEERLDSILDLILTVIL